MGEESLENRKQVWIALSELYLDTELQESDFIYIAKTLLESPFTFEEVKRIDQFEVFPVLFSNLLSPAGEWAGFNELLLVKNIMKWIETRSKLDIFAVKCIYLFYDKINRSYWKRIEEIYNQADGGSLR
ncbi:MULTISPECIES: DUF7079 family protein [Chryseobacterium]|jgi:hypothetical protein|uniref:DUF7079 domain-containing protein n=1 Tax=Chryseobacterium rhizosphaerae TaxID=395937 RepID=A0AAE3YB11_9FLAO|nr:MULTISPECIES: hypothetical protein [Chryseobacterium]MBL3550112.1 hypothetical protein [Chryseobacterium sp. KMC2]MDR6526851.1 hypothetical protein [Chryseobacterium rhizosphaerae]REC78297.1 hypothetical protein DRF57_02360 [Chryseobacterium rhizosphaerae]GEN66584.1 hypothetical protein CRH01_11520 [Chryseobacterium rhizosphaerae]